MIERAATTSRAGLHSVIVTTVDELRLLLEMICLQEQRCLKTESLKTE